jgi:hemerythrin-like metal-binding protein
MQKLQWSDAFEVGDAELDAQHRQVLDCLDGVVSALAGRQFDTARHACRCLRRELQAHASFEETVLADVEFTRLDGHVDTHREIARELAALIGHCEERCARHQEFDCPERLTNQVVRNEIIADLDYKAFLQEHPRVSRRGRP